MRILPPFSRTRRRRRRPRLRRPLTLGAVLLLLPTAGPQLGDLVMGLGVQAEGCRVLQVVDGDTVDLWCPERGPLRARLVGFDTPEIFSPQCPAELALGLQATWTLRRALWRADRLEVRIGGEDRYGRTLAALSVDGRPVRDMLIAAGLARPYDGGPRRSWCV